MTTAKERRPSKGLVLPRRFYLQGRVLQRERSLFILSIEKDPHDLLPNVFNQL